jgi:phosphatidylserine/phosphatidylglycerophosphate/cardiolipin synthase-like enzyme
MPAGDFVATGKSTGKSGIDQRVRVPHMLHRKGVVVDRQWVLVGSTIIDHRSFGLNDEVNLLVLSTSERFPLERLFDGRPTPSSLCGSKMTQRACCLVSRAMQKKMARAATLLSVIGGGSIG